MVFVRLMTLCLTLFKSGSIGLIELVLLVLDGIFSSLIVFVFGCFSLIVRTSGDVGTLCHVLIVAFFIFCCWSIALAAFKDCQMVMLPL